MKTAEKAQSQIFTETPLPRVATGHSCQASPADDINLMLWKWGERPPLKITTLIEDDGSLGKV